MPTFSASMTASAPAGSFSKNFLYAKGIDLCDSFKYLAPWPDMNARGDEVVVNKSENIPADRPKGHVFVCGSIGVASVDRGDRECYTLIHSSEQNTWAVPKGAARLRSFFSYGRLALAEYPYRITEVATRSGDIGSGM